MPRRGKGTEVIPLATETAVETLSALRTQWEATRVTMREENGELLFFLPDVAALNAVIDQLRGAGLLITSVTEKRQSLEDMFIDIISREEGK